MENNGNKVYYQDMIRKYLRRKAIEDFSSNKSWFEVVEGQKEYEKVKRDMIDEYKRRQIEKYEAKEAEKRKKEQEKQIKKQIEKETEKAVKEVFGDLFKTVK